MYWSILPASESALLVNKSSKLWDFFCLGLIDFPLFFLRCLKTTNEDNLFMCISSQVTCQWVWDTEVCLQPVWCALWKYISCYWTHNQWCSWNHWVFLGEKGGADQTPACVQLADHCSSKAILRPFLLLRWWWRMAFFLFSPSIPRLLKALASEPPTPNFDWKAVGSPSSLLTVPDQSHILGELPIIQTFLSWDCQLQQHNLLGGFWHQVNVQSHGGSWNVTGELRLPLEIYHQEPVSCWGQDACCSLEELTALQFWQRQWTSWRICTALPTRWWLQRWPSFLGTQWAYNDSDALNLPCIGLIVTFLEICVLCEDKIQQ